MNNPYDLSDEEIWGKEPTWEEQEIERLKKKIEELENKLEDKECCIEMAIEPIKANSKCGGSIQNGKFVIEYIEEIYDGYKLLEILEGKNESN